MTKILGMGNALVDIIIKINDESILNKFSLPKGSMQLVDNQLARKIEQEAKDIDPLLASGGSAANTIHGLAKLGAETGYIGKVGNDYYGAFFTNDMKSANIKTHIDFGTAETGMAITLVTPDSERTFATFLGSSVELEPSDLDNSFLKDYTILHLEGYLVQNHDLVRTALLMAKNCGMKISLDLASYNVVEANHKFLSEMVEKYVDIVFANEDEARSYTGKNPEEAAKELAGICDIAVVKTGKTGSIVQCGTDSYKIGVIQVDSLDTTGAGDLYAAGFLYGYINDMPLSKCGKMGALLAGRVIEGLGAKIPDEKWKEMYSVQKQIELE